MLQVLQALEAAIGQVGDTPDPAQKVSLAARIAAAEQANIASPLLRIATARLNSLTLSEAQAAVESAVNHLQSSVSINVQHSKLRAALQSAQEAASDRCVLASLSAVRAAGTLPLPLFDALADESRGDVSDDDESDGAALRRALAAGSVAPGGLSADEVAGFVEGVDAEVLQGVCKQVDTLLLAVGRGLKDLAAVEEHLQRIAAEATERVRPPFSAHLPFSLPLRLLAAATPQLASCLCQHA